MARENGKTESKALLDWGRVRERPAAEVLSEAMAGLQLGFYPYRLIAGLTEGRRQRRRHLDIWVAELQGIVKSTPFGKWQEPSRAAILKSLKAVLNWSHGSGPSKLRAHLHCSSGVAHTEFWPWNDTVLQSFLAVHPQIDRVALKEMVDRRHAELLSLAAASTHPSRDVVLRDIKSGESRIPFWPFSPRLNCDRWQVYVLQFLGMTEIKEKWAKIPSARELRASIDRSIEDAPVGLRAWARLGRRLGEAYYASWCPNPSLFSEYLPSALATAEQSKPLQVTVPRLPQFYQDWRREVKRGPDTTHLGPTQGVLFAPVAYAVSHLDRSYESCSSLPINAKDPPLESPPPWHEFLAAWCDRKYCDLFTILRQMAETLGICYGSEPDHPEPRSPRPHDFRLLPGTATLTDRKGVDCDAHIDMEVSPLGAPMSSRAAMTLDAVDLGACDTTISFRVGAAPLDAQAGPPLTYAEQGIPRATNNVPPGQRKSGMAKQHWTQPMLDQAIAKYVAERGALFKKLCAILSKPGRSEEVYRKAHKDARTFGRNTIVKALGVRSSSMVSNSPEWLKIATILGFNLRRNIPAGTRHTIRPGKVGLDSAIEEASHELGHYTDNRSPEQGAIQDETRETYRHILRLAQSGKSLEVKKRNKNAAEELKAKYDLGELTDEQVRESVERTLNPRK